MIATTPHPVVLRNNELAIRTATESFEISQLRAVLDEQHYLKAGRPAGHVLWQGTYEHDPESGIDRLVAVFCWAGAAKRLKDRDEWIGWDAVTCANRLKLVVQLRRFVIIDERRRPNLASQCLGLALRELPTEWQRVHGFRPLLAESFHDPARHQGTLYKVTNWTALGLTKGFRRHRADFYQDLESPKQLWIRPLQKNARTRPLVGGKQKPLEKGRDPVARRPGSEAQSRRREESGAPAQRHSRHYPARRTYLAQPSLPALRRPPIRSPPPPHTKAAIQFITSQSPCQFKRLGLTSLSGVVYAITEVPVELIRQIVDARIAELAGLLLTMLDRMPAGHALLATTNLNIGNLTERLQTRLPPSDFESDRVAGCPEPAC